MAQEMRAALITGCGKRNGIGAAIARALSAAGHAVVVQDIVVQPPPGQLPAGQPDGVLAGAMPPHPNGSGAPFEPAGATAGASAAERTLPLDSGAARRFDQLRSNRDESSARQPVRKAESGYSFAQIVVRPNLKIASVEERDRALDLLKRAEKLCLVSRALGTNLKFEPQLEVTKPIPVV